MEPILRVQNLTKTFTRRGQSNLTAVNGISFDLLPGECLGIIGESGSGKTTAVNLITRLLDATEGKIFLDGEDITLKTGKSLRMIYRKMQMVFQTPTDSFDPRRTLGDGIGESLRNCGMTRHGRRRAGSAASGTVRTACFLCRRYPARGQRRTVPARSDCPRPLL